VAYKKKRKFKLIPKIFFVGILMTCLVFGYKEYQKYQINKLKLESERLLKIEREKLEKYNKCLSKQYEETIVTDEVESLINELNSYVKKYNVSVYYEDITSGYSYKYKETEVIYGASLIKLVDALYIYDNKINLNDTMKYDAKYIKGSSKGMDKRTVGENVSLKDLINYALSVSDNTAHFMLVDYIGYNNLRDYGKSLGAKEILTGVGGEKYGNQTAFDTNIYLKRAYKIMTSSEYKDGNLLKEYMTNTYQNHLLLENEKIVSHKYGSYNNYFHNIGIVFNENPYTISILTLHGKNNYKEIINTINKKINEMHNKYREDIKDACHQDVYGSVN